MFYSHPVTAGKENILFVKTEALLSSVVWSVKSSKSKDGRCDRLMLIVFEEFISFSLRAPSVDGGSLGDLKAM